jgi:protein-S-isoprenylcysteine O-methyltransferase Ste14
MPSKTPVSPIRLAGTALYIAAWPALMFVLAGDWRWLQGWLFAAWFVGLCATVIGWLYVQDPALLAERYRRPGSGGQKGWDRAVVYVLVFGFTAWIVMMPLDAKRFHWTHPFAGWLQATGGALLLASSFLFFRAFYDNTFLSALVRVQREREHRVVSSGVYGFVRHPMYLGAVCLFVGAALLLGSAVGLAIGGGLTLLLAARIVGEEKMLVRELDGYAEYRRKVRYRLLPFVW